MASVDTPARRMEKVRFESGRIDYVLLLTVAVLLVIGLMMAYSTTFDWSYAMTGNPFSLLLRQSMWVVLGVTVMSILSRIDYLWWRRLAVPVMLVSILNFPASSDAVTSEIAPLTSLTTSVMYEGVR